MVDRHFHIQLSPLLHNLQVNNAVLLELLAVLPEQLGCDQLLHCWLFIALILVGGRGYLAGASVVDLVLEFGEGGLAERLRVFVRTTMTKERDLRPLKSLPRLHPCLLDLGLRSRLPLRRSGSAARTLL